MMTERYSVKSILQGMFMLISSSIVSAGIGYVRYTVGVIIVSWFFRILQKGRWAKPGREDPLFLLGVFWPAMVLSFYWIARREEADRRTRIVEEVMSS